MPRTAAAHALATPHWTVTTKTVHQLPQLGRICQSPLAHLHCIVTFRSQPCVFLREPDHIHPKARRLRLCLYCCFLQYIHVAVQVVNLLLKALFLLAEAGNLGLLGPWLGLQALLDGRPCNRGHLAQRSSTVRWSRVARATWPTWPAFCSCSSLLRLRGPGIVQGGSLSPSSSIFTYAWPPKHPDSCDT